MHTHRTGDISESKILARFIELGYVVLIPFNQGLRYDLVIEKEGAFQRVQVKTAWLMENGCIAFNSSSLDKSEQRDKTFRDYREDIDLFAAYCPQLEKIYLVPVADAASRHCYLRIEPTQNGQTKGIRWAADYEL